MSSSSETAILDLFAPDAHKEIMMEFMHAESMGEAALHYLDSVKIVHRNSLRAELMQLGANLSPKGYVLEYCCSSLHLDIEKRATAAPLSLSIMRSLIKTIMVERKNERRKFSPQLIN